MEDRMNKKNEKKDSHIRISVVIPVYNVESYVERAIESVLKQTYKPDEIILINDGSTDGSAAKIRKYEPDIIYIYQKNAGLAAARNTGIKASKGDWITFLDSDDEWLPNNLSLQANLVKHNPDLVWSAGNFIDCLVAGNRRGVRMDPDTIRKYLAGKDYFDDLFDALIKHVGIHSNTVMIDRKAFDEVGYFREGIPCTEDFDMWYRMAIRWPKIGYIPDPIAVYYVQRTGSLMDIIGTKEKKKVVCEVFERTLKLAEEQGRLDKFQMYASFCLRRTIRSYLFQYNMVSEVKNIIKQFPQLFSFFYKMIIWFLTLCPHITALSLHTISKTVRFLKLRSIVVGPPRK
jgi:glycosyltransferase involved in cell wall biosynthesis